jgi:hypothetical protein
MAGRRKARRRGAATLLARLRGLFATWLAALVLFVQLGLNAAYAPTAASSADLAAAALSAAIGQEVSLCDQNGPSHHPGAPGRSCPCCDDCALCRLATHVVALAPERLATSIAPAGFIAAPFASHRTARAPPSFVFPSARPRAPPVPV